MSYFNPDDPMHWVAIFAILALILTVWLRRTRKVKSLKRDVQNAKVNTESAINETLRKLLDGFVTALGYDFTSSVDNCKTTVSLRDHSDRGSDIKLFSVTFADRKAHIELYRPGSVGFRTEYVYAVDLFKALQSALKESLRQEFIEYADRRLMSAFTVKPTPHGEGLEIRFDGNELARITFLVGSPNFTALIKSARYDGGTYTANSLGDMVSRLNAMQEALTRAPKY